MFVALLSTTVAALAPPASALKRLGPNGPGFTIVENFMSLNDVSMLKEDVSLLNAEGRFRVAGVGDASTNRMADDVRRCEQCFLYPRGKHGGGGHQDGRNMLYSVLDDVRNSLQQETGETLDGLLTEGLYAQYPRGGFYRRHIDSYPNTPQASRKFSFLLYCNEGWEESDGGCLRIHTDGGLEVAPAGAPPSYVDVQPKAGTLVVFRSDVPHEVLDTSASRLAMVGWFNAPPEGVIGDSNTRRTLIGGLVGALVVGNGVKALLAQNAAAEAEAARVAAELAAAERAAAERAAAEKAAAEMAAAEKAAAQAAAAAETLVGNS